ncbi:heavy metal translocating P-type ATPase [Zwartia panacis]|uniref:heavy metal translocating P-type ATPase n=1 Tax=Zwartia panacis TaxID=2683345 RepID=UPI0025B46FA5|nr:heavy metal translocating P-type ATPase [Zwartia panacis]MDN4017497.1 heavy metal translocating P-type ATPase [Zwartia panacis]
MLVQTLNSDTTPQVELAIKGMTCASCVLRVEKALAKVPGVAQANVNLATHRASLSFTPSVTDTQSLIPQLVKATEDAGYEASVLNGDKATELALAAEQANEAVTLKRSFLVALALTLPVFVLEMGSHLFPFIHQLIHDSIGMQRSWWLQALLTTLILAGPGRSFFSKGFPALWRLGPDMNSLVALGASSAWLYSMVTTFMPQWLPEGARHVYFEAAAVIVTLILLGRLLEMRARGRTGSAIKHLIGLQPRQARVMVNGIPTDVEIDLVKPGDLILVRPGEKVATDGVISEGQPYLNESMITGEPIPVTKHLGDKVTAGTLNTTTSFTYRTTHTGAQTVLARIIRMVENAQGAKLPIQAVVDRVTARFVPAIMLCALLTFVTWLVWGPAPSLSYALVNAVAVLIIACPCAMGLATPTSIMVGTGRAAELGVLFRQGDALQRLRDVTVIAFDKTGTLTQGKPTLTDLVVLDPLHDRATVLGWTAAMQLHSEHPIAQAIVAAATAEKLALPAASDFMATSGAGVAATVSNKALLSGAQHFMRTHGIDTQSQNELTEHWAAQGKTPIYLAVDGKLTAMMAVSDPIKPSAAQAISALKKLGIHTVMITGDHPRTAQAVASQLGIDEVHAQVLPEGKVDQLLALREKNHVIAFVGDGINDAPALATADVGIAIGTGTDVAIEAASVVLMSDNLMGVATAVNVSRSTLKNIHQNLFWAFAYNVALVPVAAGVLYPSFGVLLSPVFAAGAMACSSVFVVMNALRLRQIKAATLS